MRLIVLAVALGVSCSLAPIALVAQPSDKVYRIGVLERTPVAVNAANLEGFRQGLRALGYLEGKTSLSSIDPPTAATSGFPTWPRSWPSSRWT